MRDLQIIAVSGFTESLNDQSPFWGLVDAVDAIPDTTLTERTWDELVPEDLLNKDVVICYSWGCASVFKAFDTLQRQGRMPKIPLLVILAGVPRGILQCVSVSWKGGWTVPDEVGSAICFQVNSFPVSHPIANSGPARINRLVTSAGGWGHVAIQDADEVHNAVLGLIEGVDAIVNPTGNA